MKKYLPIFLLLSLPTFFYAQSFPTLADNPVWTIEIWNGTNETTVGAGDTLINNNHWTPLLNVPASYGLSNFYYREEAHKVYIRMDGTDSGRKEYLMYDFSLETGDSVYIGIPGTNLSTNPDTVLYEIWNIDSVFVNNILRKRMHVACHIMNYPLGANIFYLTSWIEGIGDSRVAFPPTSCLDGSDDSGVCGGCIDCFSFDCLNVNEGLLFSSGENTFCTYNVINLSRIYVDENVESTGRNGSSWQYAFDNLQDAIEIAEEGDTIWVAQGTYLPTFQNNREIFFNLNEGVKIYGGFNATETTLAERDWENNETILSGDIGMQGDSTDNSYHVVYTIGTDSTAVLDGFTITKGYAIHADNAYFHHLIRGGGMIVDTNEEYPEASPSIQNCNFVLNVGKFGGGLACNGVNDGYANPNLYNCTFFQNTGVLEGGGIYKTGPSREGNPQRFESCTFENNWAWQGGAGVAFIGTCNDYYFDDCTFLNNVVIAGAGAIYFLESCGIGSIVVNNSVFDLNSGKSGGAFGFLYFGSSLNDSERFDAQFNSCSFLRNDNSVGNGGAMSVNFAYAEFNLTVTKCTYKNNSSLNRGGAISISPHSEGEAFVSINESIFVDNYSISLPAAGAINLQGDLSAQATSHIWAKVQNTQFYKNRGALAVASGPGTAEAEIINCTFYDNGSYPIAKNWTSTFDYEDFYNLMSLSNCIIWEPNIPLKDMLYNGSPNNQHLYDYTINNCLIPQSACDLPGGDEACNEGMVFGQNPMFVDADNGDLRVGACSPAINAGDNSFSDGIEVDISGNVRLMEDVVDIGAYERMSFVMNLAEVDSVSCPGGSDGAAFFESNGDLPYNYLWDLGVLSDTTATDLEVGEYVFTVTDAAGCSDVLTVTIPAVDTLDVHYFIEDATASDAQDGALTLQNITGGTPPYTWTWNTEDTTSSLENIFAGWYVLQITDANDCISEFNFEVSFLDATNDFPADEIPVLQPNPVSSGGEVQLVFPKSNASKYIVEWLDIRGGTLKDLPKISVENVISFDTGKLPSGLYFVKVNNEGRFHVFRVVVQ